MNTISNRLILAKWKMLGLISVVAFIIATITYYIYPRKQDFDINDENIKEPYIKNEYVNMLNLVIIGGLIPISICYTYLRIYKDKKENMIYLLFITAQLITLAITNSIKAAVGSLRPDFLDRCKLINGICTGNPDSIIEGRKSFPSGHTSFVFCGTMFTIFFINSKRLRKHYNALIKYLIAGLISVILCIIAIGVGLSRILDHRHRLKDVITGAGIGTFSSLMSIIAI
ncbi:Phospholipid phosphatase 5 [Astathelohania contejeani]|uniref:Phospholipid phosphatase 5 n=1 Tax=Astathelohania contejeani TaxID=164912 RepID=A0ABQ7HZ09_9MICR|nr:Phospholipid phosphatase 5 [Thelohania contejeani]